MLLRGICWMLTTFLVQRLAWGERHWDTTEQEQLSMRLRRWSEGEWHQDEHSAWHWHFEGKRPVHTAGEFSECLRGKWVYFVGDSSTRIMFAALVGLLEPAALDDRFMPQYDRSKCEGATRSCDLVLTGHRTGAAAHPLELSQPQIASGGRNRHDIVVTVVAVFS